jgi:hypothetical protein
MTLLKLSNELKELGISQDKYYLHGLYGSTDDDNKLSLTIRKGAYSIGYEVYFKERGEKHSIRIFTDENEACQYLYMRLKENKEIEDKYSWVHADL